MNAFHNDPAVKEKYLARFAAHRAADEVIQGQGFENGRGCFVGCTLDAYDHSRFPAELGIPTWMAYLCDRIFENIPENEAPQFGTDLLMAIPIGADLEQIRVPFLVDVLRRSLTRLNSDEAYVNQVRSSIEGVIAALLSGVGLDNARSAAESAAESVARSVARSVAESAAWSAAWSAESAAWSAESAAWSAAWSAESAAASAESAEWRAQRESLLNLIRNCAVIARS